MLSNPYVAQVSQHCLMRGFPHTIRGTANRQVDLVPGNRSRPRHMEIVGEIKICQATLQSFDLFDLCVDDAGTDSMRLVPVQESRLDN